MAFTATITQHTTTLTKRQYCGLHFHCRSSDLDGNQWKDIAASWQVTAAPSGWSMIVDDPRTGGLGASGWNAATDALTGPTSFAIYADLAGDYTISLTLTNKSTGATATASTTVTVADSSGYTTVYVNPALATGLNDGTSEANAYQSWGDCVTGELQTQGDADKLILVKNGQTLLTIADDVTNRKENWFVNAGSGTSGNIVIMPDTTGGSFNWDTQQTNYAQFWNNCDNITIVGATFINQGNSGVQSGFFKNATGAARTGFTLVDCSTNTSDNIGQCGGELGGVGTLAGYLGLRNNFTNSSADERFSPDDNSTTVVCLGCTFDRNGATDSFRSVYTLTNATGCWFAFCDIQNEYNNNDVALRFRSGIDCGAVACVIAGGIRSDEESATTNDTHYFFANEVTSNTGADAINACLYAVGSSATYVRNVFSEGNVYIRKDNIGVDADDRGDCLRYQDAGTLYSVNDTMIYQPSATGGRVSIVRSIGGGTVALSDCLMVSDTTATNWSAADDQGSTLTASGCVWPLDHGGKEPNALDYFDINGTGYASSAAIEAALVAGWANNTDANIAVDASYVAASATAATASAFVIDYASLVLAPVVDVGAIQPDRASLDPSAAPAGDTGAYTYDGESKIYLVYDSNVSYTGSSPHPITITNGSGSTETVTSVTTSGNMVEITFTGDIPQLGNSNWTITFDNSSGRLTTDSNSAPVASFTTISVGIAESPYANNTPTLDAFVGGTGYTVRFTDPVIFAEIDTSWLTTLYNGSTVANSTISGSGTDRLSVDLDFILQPGATLAVSWDGSSIQDDATDLFLGATTLNATLGTLTFGTQNSSVAKISRFRNPNRVGFKNTNTGPLFIDTYVNTTTGYYIGSTSAADSYKPADYGITGARYALVQVHTTDANVVVSTGISGAISNPHSGSYRVGRSFGMPFIQLPVDSTSEVRVMADPVAGITCLYTVSFID